MGAVGAGYWIAHTAFWILVVFAAAELGVRRTSAFVLLWVIGYAGSWWLPQGGAVLLSYVALLDIALVLMIFKGDVRLT